MSSLLTIVEAANTGLTLWSTVGPWLQQMIEEGKVMNVPITQEDLDRDSINLGHDLDLLQEAIDKAKAEGR